MAFFGVTVEEIESIRPHPNADRLELGKLVGLSFQFVVAKDTWKPGDKCLYFPVDSVLPDWLLKELGLEGKLAGSQKNRVKTIRLRGEYSQGLIGPIDLVTEKAPVFPRDIGLAVATNDVEMITSTLGVVKYEQPEVPCKAGNLHALPVGLSKYDIEGADRYSNVVNELLSKESVWVTEKMEGSNLSVTWNAAEEHLYVNQRNHTIVPIEGQNHDWWKIAEKERLNEFVRFISKLYPMCNVTIYGEALGPGIQKNIYGFSNLTCRIFDVKINEHWLDTAVVLGMIWDFYGNKDMYVPVLHHGPLEDFLNGRTVQEASNGTSAYRNILREGIVIRPDNETRSENLGGSRLIIKQRSPEYLANEK